MKYFLSLVTMAIILQLVSPPAHCSENDIYPTAVIPFKERGEGMEGYGVKIRDIIFALLSENPELYLVDREDLNAVLQEQELSISGMVSQNEITRAGQLAGAKILITGSVLQVDQSLLIIGKVIGAETSRIFGTKVKGEISDDLYPLVESLVTNLSTIIQEQAENLVPPPEETRDPASYINERLADAKRPRVMVHIEEHHHGRLVIDPAAETEMSLLLGQTGFDLLEYKEEDEKRPKGVLLIKGEGFSEFVFRRNLFVCVKARVELKAIDTATGNIIATDRQTSVVLDSSELIAGKKALQEAAAIIAQRMLPTLVKP